ncbi:hypothetical protein SUGI_1390800 [Cryptomeria japonica]|uniref:DUF4220 domain-containing protein n=1 Tax=Cryptomeria japonica TaxID=3369 RepID=A0AAD3NLW7_CRYJA|nr:hypothetical protein SUGI_1390800 [Cryptomeria japonica]
MCICKQEGFVFAAGFLLLVAGVCKYVERTAALAFATYFEIVNSTEPIFKFMEHEDKIEPGEFNYIVVGEKQLNDWWENHLWPTSPREFPGVTTIQHVWSHEDRQPTDDYLLCLSYALFKLYKRQFVSLYFYEWSRNKTRRFFLRNGLECENVFRVVSYVLQRLLWRIRKRLGNQYWKNVIPQYRVIDTCFKTKSSCIWKVARKYPRSFIVLWYIKLRYTSATAVEDDLKQLIFQKLQNVCSPDEDIAICKFYAFEACLSEDLKWASKMDVEDLILTWHIATAICEEHWKPNPG